MKPMELVGEVWNFCLIWLFFRWQTWWRDGANCLCERRWSIGHI